MARNPPVDAPTPLRSLVVGGSGQVGRALRETLERRGHPITATYLKSSFPGGVRLGLTDGEVLRRLIDDWKPDWIFCPAAMTHVDLCEDQPDHADTINHTAPAALARLAAGRGCGFVYYSTDYVFDGERGPNAENDDTHPLNVYGHSKLLGEQAVMEAYRNATEGQARSGRARPRRIGGCLILRTAMVYGPDSQEKNFVYQILRNARASSPFNVFTDQYSTPTHSADLALCSVLLAEKDMSGTYHVTGPDFLNRLEVCRLACEVFHLRDDFLSPGLTAGQKARRPLRGGLRSDKVRTALDYDLKGFREGLLAMREVLAKQERARS